jgi:hypothetical protein
MYKTVTWTIVILALLGSFSWGAMKAFGLGNYEKANYKVSESHGSIEIRQYAEMIVAEGEFFGEREKTLKEGFRIVSSYIFGKNVSAQKVNMTVPIMQQQSEKIAMTAPVMQEESQNDSWTLSFVMPSHYTLQTLPTPSSSEIKLKKVPAKRLAVIRFSGMWTQANLDKRKIELQDFIKSKHLNCLSNPIYAFFNPPWTPWFMRRNEIMMKIE